MKDLRILSSIGYSESRSGAYWFKTVGRGGPSETTCFVDAGTGAISFEGSASRREAMLRELRDAGRKT